MRSTFYTVTGQLSKQYRVALVADTHNTQCDRIVDDLERHSPDIIVLAGDIVYGAEIDRSTFPYNPQKLWLKEFANADQQVHALPDIAPTFFSYGNHEWLLTPADEKRIEEARIKVLHNTWTEYGELIIGGLSSPDVGNYRIFQDEYRREHPSDTRGNLRREYFYWHTHEIRKTPDATWLHTFENTKGYKMLICHHPEYWEMKEPKLKNHCIDLVLAGHAHGGQIRMGNRGLFATGQGWFPRFTSGIHHGDYGDMVISRGLSNTMRFPRLFNPWEMVYVDIVPNWC